MELRKFRNRYFLTNATGRWFARLYYRYSPPVAEFIARHESLRFITRTALTPLVYGIKYPKASSVVLIVLPAAVLIRRKLKFK